jgi:hypothetical protein
MFPVRSASWYWFRALASSSCGAARRVSQRKCALLPRLATHCIQGPSFAGGRLPTSRLRRVGHCSSALQSENCERRLPGTLAPAGSQGNRLPCPLLGTGSTVFSCALHCESRSVSRAAAVEVMRPVALVIKYLIRVDLCAAISPPTRKSNKHRTIAVPSPTPL